MSITDLLPWKKKEKKKVTIEVPGMTQDDVDVTLSGKRLILRGEKQEEEELRGRSTYGLRRSEQAFRRSIDLPCQINADQVEASLRNGVLTVTLPKADHARRRRRIVIKGR